MLRIAFDGEEPEDATLAAVAAGVGPRIVHSDRELAATRDALSAYLEGDDDTLALPVDLSLAHGPFRRAVLETLHREVHRGEVITYGALAAEAGNPRAVRATGTACATNPVPIVVPCHRVLPSHPPPRQLRRRAGAQARAADARGRALEGLSRYGALLRLPEARAPLVASAVGVAADRHVRAGDPAARARHDGLVRERRAAWWARSGWPTRSAPSPRGG